MKGQLGVPVCFAGMDRGVQQSEVSPSRSASFVNSKSRVCRISVQANGSQSGVVINPVEKTSAQEDINT